SYKTAGGFAQQELDWLMAIGGISLRTDWRLSSATQLLALRESFDAVYLAIGLSRVDPLAIPGESLAGVRDAVDFIAELLQTENKASLPIGRRVVVIGGGMTAVDAAVQSKLLGAEDVHIVYRRGPETMGASAAERDWAQTHGVTIHHWLAPETIEGDGHVTAVRFARQHLAGGKLAADGSHETIAADMVFKAIGQKLDTGLLAGAGFTLQAGRIVADADGRSGVAGLWVGGDCRAGGRDLTVEAVEDGKRAALAIHAQLSST
ncbi:FAD-dependent oxidoreductase, partial [Aquabacterium sp.]|uniref:FAD-dependent oxidoreductase n=1 Tax=Aquabacterium sp. TaxID=1872578 RepID=UPI002B5E77E8